MFESNRKLLLIFIVMIIGRWSERRGVLLISQFVLSSSLDVMAVMSGDVDCFAWFVDDRVGSFLFNMVWSEF